MAATTVPPFTVGAPVVYAADPLLYGEMEVRVVRVSDRRVVCKIDPDGVRPSYEIFDPHELRAP